MTAPLGYGCKLGTDCGSGNCYDTSCVNSDGSCNPLLPGAPECASVPGKPPVEGVYCCLDKHCCKSGDYNVGHECTRHDECATKKCLENYCRRNDGSCVDEDDCVSTNKKYCGSDGECHETRERALMAKCSGDEDCASNFCYDGVCRRGDGTCEPNIRNDPDCRRGQCFVTDARVDTDGHCHILNKGEECFITKDCGDDPGTNKPMNCDSHGYQVTGLCT